MAEKNFVSYRRELVKINNKKMDGGLMDYEDAEAEVVDYLSKQKMIEISDIGNEEVNKTKEYLREKKNECRRHVIECIYQKNISVRGYQDHKIEKFIEEMVSEYAGYSALEEAFDDPLVDDIYCIDWETIFVERDGVNMRYWN